MALPGLIVHYQFTQDGVDYDLYSKDAPGRDINGFIGGLSEVGSFDPAPRTVTVSGHTRRRYPGGPPISVPGHSRTTIFGGRANRRTLPGNNAFIEVPVAEDSGGILYTITFTHTAPFTQLYVYAQANAIGTFRLRSQDGTVYDIGGSGGGD